MPVAQIARLSQNISELQDKSWQCLQDACLMRVRLAGFLNKTCNDVWHSYDQVEHLPLWLDCKTWLRECSGRLQPLTSLRLPDCWDQLKTQTSSPVTMMLSVKASRQLTAALAAHGAQCPCISSLPCCEGTVSGTASIGQPRNPYAESSLTTANLILVGACQAILRFSS